MTVRRTNNSKLPYELLQMAFEEIAISYGSCDRVFPLLLVCKDWFDAAVGYDFLWTIFYITHSDPRPVKFFIERCLSICSSDSPLEIYFGGVMDKSLTMGTSPFHQSGDAVLGVLAGPNGETAKRWKIFQYWNSSDWVTSSGLSRALSYPTPALETFTMDGLEVDLEGPILPHSPSLTDFSISRTTLPNFPDLENAKNLYLFGVESAWFDCNSVVKARNVVRMELLNWGGHPQLPTLFPELQELRLQGEIGDRTLVGFSAPKLRCLALDLSDGTGHGVCLACPSLNLEKLEELRVFSTLWDEHLISGLGTFWVTRWASDLGGLVNSSLRVPKLRVDTKAARIVLKLLEDECKRSSPSQAMVLKLDDVEMSLAEGQERLVCIQQFRERAGISPSNDWSSITRDMVGDN